MIDPIKAALRIAKAEAGPVIGLPEGEDAPRNWEDAQKIIAAQRAAAYDASLVPLKVEEAGIVNSPEYQAQQAEALKAQSFNPTRLSSMQPVADNPGAQFSIPQFTTPRARAHETERVVDLAREIENKNARGEFNQALGNTWPVQAAEDIWNAAKAPKQALMGELDPNSELAIKRMFDLSGALTMGSLPVAKPDPTKAGIFGGVGARTADTGLLKQAQEAHALGLPEAEIWQGTGWWKAPDGNWKFEIPDQAMRIPETPKDSYLWAMENVVDHPKLFEAYPQIRDLGVKFEDLGEGGPHGYHMPAHGDNPGFISINKRLPPEEQRSVMAHEIQHRVQDIEGFAKGANPDQFNFPAPVRMRLAEEEDALFQALQVQEMMQKQNMSFEDAANLVFRNSNEGKVNPKVMEYAAADPERVKRVLGMVQEAQSLTRGNGYEGYRRTMGEVEARNVQARLGNPEWIYPELTIRRNFENPPSSTMDVPANKQLHGPPEGVLGMSAPEAPAMSAAPEPPPRNLSPISLYSHGAESAQTLPQPRGTPQQFRAMLEKAGVKPDEMKGFEEAFAGQKSITREQAAEFFNERMPKVEETVLGGETATGKWKQEEIIRFTSDDAAWNRFVHDHLPEGFENLTKLKTPDERMEVLERRFNNEVDQYLKTVSSAPTKFQQYQLPGSTNYREVLLRLPETKNTETIDQMRTKLADLDFQRRNLRSEMRSMPEATPQREEIIDKFADIDKQIYQLQKQIDNYKPQQLFQSSHWDEPNVLAHLRMADRDGPPKPTFVVENLSSGFRSPEFITMEEAQAALKEYPASLQKSLAAVELRGKPTKILHLEEIQSDWAQKGRKEGFKGQSENGSVYSAPYVTNTAQWTDLALKRALKEAVDGGYDQMIITPGQVQADRYDLSKSVNRITFNDNYRNGRKTAELSGEPAEGILTVYDLNGKPIINKKATPNEIEDLIGKDYAKKLFEQNPSSVGGRGQFFRQFELVGSNLKVGGEGMKQFYDRIVPTRLKELLRKIDPSVKVGPAKVKAGDADQDMLSIPITPKMREAIQRGLPAYAHGGSVKPSSAQIEAGNYKKHHVRRFGLDIAIENKKGSTRSGTNKSGKQWSVKMPADYGYIKRTEGADGDHVDVYLGPSDAEIVFVVNQVDLNTRKFDEHKVLLGFDTFKAAMETYKAGFSDGRGGERAESAEAMTLDQFKKWLDKGDQNKVLTAAAMNAIKPFGPDAAQRAVKLARSKLGATQ